MMAPSVEDRLAINDLFVRYTTALDAGEVDTIVACFTEDGALESPAVGVYSGRQGIRDFADRFARFREAGRNCGTSSRTSRCRWTAMRRARRATC